MSVGKEKKNQFIISHFLPFLCGYFLHLDFRMFLTRSVVY